MRLIESSESPWARIRPQMAMVVDLPLMALPSASTSATWSWIEAWSLAVINRSANQYFSYRRQFSVVTPCAVAVPCSFICAMCLILDCDCPPLICDI